jgi:hypothetical protein
MIDCSTSVVHCFNMEVEKKDAILKSRKNISFPGKKVLVVKSNLCSKCRLGPTKKSNIYKG